jgi:hypothetical protein
MWHLSRKPMGYSIAGNGEGFANPLSLFAGHFSTLPDKGGSTSIRQHTDAVIRSALCRKATVAFNQLPIDRVALLRQEERH